MFYGWIRISHYPWWQALRWAYTDLLNWSYDFFFTSIYLTLILINDFRKATKLAVRNTVLLYHEKPIATVMLLIGSSRYSQTYWGRLELKKISRVECSSPLIASAGRSGRRPPVASHWVIVSLIRPDETWRRRSLSTVLTDPPFKSFRTNDSHWYGTCTSKHTLMKDYDWILSSPVLTSDHRSTIGISHNGYDWNTTVQQFQVYRYLLLLYFSLQWIVCL